MSEDRTPCSSLSEFARDKGLKPYVIIQRWNRAKKKCEPLPEPKFVCCNSRGRHNLMYALSDLNAWHAAWEQKSKAVEIVEL